MPSEDPCTHIQDIQNDPAVFDLDFDKRLTAIATYPRWKQDIFLVLSCEGLIGNGGTPGIFCNDGCIVPRTIEAYGAIGAIEHAEWLRRLAALFGDPYPLDLDIINDRITDTPAQIWDESSQFFHDNKNWFRIIDLLEKYRSK